MGIAKRLWDVARSNASDFASAFGWTADQGSGSISGNGDDVYELRLDGALVDIYGVVGTDGSGKDWEYTDSVAQLGAALDTPNPVWTASEWSITGGTGTASPGVR